MVQTDLLEHVVRDHLVAELFEDFLAGRQDLGSLRACRSMSL